MKTVALCGTIGIKSVSYTDLKFSKHLSDVTSVLVYNEFVKNASWRTVAGPKTSHSAGCTPHWVIRNPISAIDGYSSVL